jgi:CBS domain containing-hemolysin-like protein
MTYPPSLWEAWVREELEEDRVVEIEKDKWIVDGRFPIEDLERLLGVELPKGPYSTVAGLLSLSSETDPQKGRADEHPGCYVQSGSIR